MGPLERESTGRQQSYCMMEEEKRPLAGLTVIELTVNVPGPFCAMVLADLGARVIKVEPPGGDPLRHSAEMWAGLNRGKDSLVLDLKTDGGGRVLGKLVESGDIVLEGSRPGVAERLGADYPTMSEINPGLVYCSISGFGQDGPWRDRPAHDINYLALSGYLDVEASVSGRPWPPPVLMSDLASGLYAAIAVLAAVCGRQISGEGAYVDLSMTESAVSLLGLEIGGTAGEGEPATQPNVSYIPHYGVFPCADDRWLSVGIVHEDHFWERLCHVAGLTDLAGLKFDDRLARSEEILTALHQTFVTRPAAEWERVLQEADVPAAAVVQLSEVFDSPQFKSRGTFVDVGIHRFVAQPMRFSTGSVAPTAGPPELGQHAEAVLTELGYDRDERAKLQQANAVDKTGAPVPR